MRNKKIKRKRFLIVTFLLVFFLFISIIVFYLKSINPKLIRLSNEYLRENVYNILNNVSENVYESVNFNDFLNIYQNNDGEILYANYNLKNSYQLLNEITKEIQNELNQKEEKIITVPFFINRSYVLLNYLGPKLNYKVDYLNMSLSNIYTKITNYGLNNCLIEAYIKINIEGMIMTPIVSDKQTISYDLLISSSIISGRVPTLYGSSLTVQSTIFDIPLSF